jgi:hypothetical protein
MRYKAKVKASGTMTIWINEDASGNLEIEDIEGIEDIEDFDIIEKM